MDRLLFRKEGRARYISHLDLMRTFQRMFLRAGIAIKHTEGFNPHPYVAFAMPLPLGTESDCELMDFGLLGDTDRKDVPALLNRAAPEGITVLAVYEAERKLSAIAWLAADCRLVYDHGVPPDAAARIRELFSRSSLTVRKKTKRGEAELDVIPLLKDFSLEQTGERELLLHVTLAAQAPTVAPAQIAEAVRLYEPALAPDFAAFRRREVYDQDGGVFR